MDRTGEYSVVDDSGTRWFAPDEWGNVGLHREDDLPARIDSNGDRWWYWRGALHREDGKPAFLGARGGAYWYQHGLLHREGDEPAYIDARGGRTWAQRGLIHRDGDAPAWVSEYGRCMWYRGGVPYAPTAFAVHFYPLLYEVESGLGNRLAGLACVGEGEWTLY